jgi:nitroreductase
MELPLFAKPASELIRERYSCRVFEGKPLPAESLEELLGFAASLGPGPRGGKPRFGLIAATHEDPSALRGLGTYGFIQNPSAFLAVIRPAGGEMVDLGWATELVVLKAVELGMGSCWLGGTFQRSRFAAAAKLERGERLSIVIALGREASGAREAVIRRRIAGGTRKPWADIFFDGSFEKPISGPEELVGLGLDPSIADLLEALRLSPSASNKQPWALLRAGSGWEIFLRRTPGYRSGLARLAGLADTQMNDMGIAMSHFALAAREKKLEGLWRSAPSALLAPGAGASYVATFGS